ncbi:MAG: thiol reductant ABC exporter subunit CydD [Thermoleophilia bacterium]
MHALHRRLLCDSRAARWHLVAAVALGGATAATVVAQALLLARVVAGVFIEGQSLGDVRVPLVALAAVSALRGALAWGYELAGHLGASRAISAMRVGLVRHVLGARPAAPPGSRSGELAAAAVNGIDALDAYFGRYVPQVFLSAIVPLAVLAVVMPLDGTSAVIMAVTLPVIPVFMILVGKAAQVSARSRLDALQALSGRFLDVVRGLPALRAHGRAEAQSQALESTGDRFRRETMSTLRVAFLSALILELAAALGVALVAVAVGIRLAGGGMELQAGLAVLILAPELYAPLRQLGGQFHASADGMAAAERVHEVLDRPALLERAADPVALPDPAWAPLRLEGVRFRYPARDVPVLEGVDLGVAPGERVALVGPSGAGKSTLLALLMRLADPEGGRVTVGGVDLRDGDPQAWRRRVAWVPQRPGLVAGTVADNVRMADRGASDARVREALAAAGAGRLVASLPRGIDTAVGEGGRALSAGEAQRVALARAFLRDAPLVLLDEPTAALDPATAAEVAEAIERLCRGRTAVMAVHRLDLARRADRVVVLEGGRVVEVGPPEMLGGLHGAFGAQLAAATAGAAA